MYGSYIENPFNGETELDKSAIIFDDYDSPSTGCDKTKNNGFGPIPEKRQKRAAFVSVGLSFTIMVVLLGAFTKPKNDLYVVDDNTSMLGENEMVCKKNDRYYHVGIFIWSLNLIGIILGEFVNRFCLMFEEYFHLHSRYNSSKMNMVRACFSDISFRAVFFATLVAFVIIGSTLLSQGAKYFKFEYIEIILSGVGSSTLVLYLLSLDTLSRVQVSSLMENNNRLVANGLAWSYYFGYLKLILPGLQNRIKESDWGGKLSSNKLFILMPRDCCVYNKLSDESDDGKLEVPEGGAIEYDVERAGICNRSYRNTVYRIKQDNPDLPLYVLAEYATPLCALFDMRHASEASLSEEDRDEQAKLFVRTLEAILSNPSEPAVRNKCKLVPYARGRVNVSKILAEAVLKDINGIGSSDNPDGIEGQNETSTHFV